MDVTNNGLKRPRDHHSAQSAYQPGSKRLRTEADDFFRPQSTESTGFLDTVPYEMLGAIFDQIGEAYSPSAALQCRGVCHRLKKFVDSTPMLRVYMIGFSALKQAWALLNRGGEDKELFEWPSMVKTWACQKDSTCCQFAEFCIPTNVMSLEHVCCKLLAAYDFKNASDMAGNKSIYNFAIADTLHRYNTAKFKHVIDKCFNAYELTPIEDEDHAIFNDAAGFFTFFPALMSTVNPNKAIEFCRRKSDLIALKHVAHGYSRYVEKFGFNPTDFAVHQRLILDVAEERKDDFGYEPVDILAHMCEAVALNGHLIPPESAETLLDLIDQEDEFYPQSGFTALSLLMKHSREFFQTKNETEEDYAYNCYMFIMALLAKIDQNHEYYSGISVEVLSWMGLQFPQFKHVIANELQEALEASMTYPQDDDNLGIVAKSISNQDFRATVNAISVMENNLLKLDALLLIDPQILMLYPRPVLAIISGMNSPDKLTVVYVEKIVKLLSSMQLNTDVSAFCRQFLDTNMNISEINLKRCLISLVRGLGPEPYERDLAKQCCQKLHQECTSAMPRGVEVLSEMLMGLKSINPSLAALLTEQALADINAMDDSQEKAKLLLWLSDECLRE
jgi:hypothetical protein